MSAPGHSTTARQMRAHETTHPHTTHDVVFLIDPDEEKVVGVTSGIQHLLGYETIDIVGRKFSSLYTLPNTDTRSKHDPSFYWGTGDTLQLSFHCADRTSRTFAVTFSPMHANDRRHLHMAVLHEPYNVTAELEPVARQQIEEHALRTILREVHHEPLESKLLSKISHQVRTPLGIILSSAGILGRYDESLDSGQRQEYLAAITDSVHRITRVLEDVVCLSRLEAGAISCNPKPENFLHLCHGLIEEARSAAQKPIPITFLHTNIPEQVACDEPLIRLILLHLLSNSLKFATDNQPIQLKLKREGHLCCISLSDSGIGIPASDLPSLYQPFHRGTNTGDVTGNGLGLAIVKKCVTLHGGTIHCESLPASGTTFHVHLPLFDPPNKIPPP